MENVEGQNCTHLQQGSSFRYASKNWIQHLRDFCVHKGFQHQRTTGFFQRPSNYHFYTTEVEQNSKVALGEKIEGIFC